MFIQRDNNLAINRGRAIKCFQRVLTVITAVGGAILLI